MAWPAATRYERWCEGTLGGRWRQQQQRAPGYGVDSCNCVSIRAAAGNGRRGTWMRRVVSVDGEVLPSLSAAFEGQPALLQCCSVSRRLQNLEREC